MGGLSTLDLAVIVAYLAGITAFGLYVGEEFVFDPLIEGEFHPGIYVFFRQPAMYTVVRQEQICLER